MARYIREGQFGLWQETGRINDIVNQGAAGGLGLGEAVGRAVLEGDYPGKETSLLAQAARLGVAALVHVGIGQDIIHSHPNFDGGATGLASHRDFLALAHRLENLENGVVMNFGSAVMAPEVYLKALAMARNVARGRGETITRFLALVCDLFELPPTYRTEASKSDPRYYFRPWKTMLVRTVADGGQSHYVRGRHADTLPALWRAALAADAKLAVEIAPGDALTQDSRAMPGSGTKPACPTTLDSQTSPGSETVFAGASAQGSPAAPAVGEGQGGGAGPEAGQAQGSAAGSDGQASPKARGVREKILPMQALALRLDELRAQGKTVVLCHGCFDLLHPGHFKYLQAAKAMGDVLVATCSPDRYVDKGPGRPVFNEQLRAE